MEPVSQLVTRESIIVASASRRGHQVADALGLWQFEVGGR